MMKQIVLVGFGGMIGSLLRYAATLIIQHKNFPLAIFIVNVLGSLILGLAVGYCLKNNNINI
jgi:CrcB protein